jgi:hypothetical protein
MTAHAGDLRYLAYGLRIASDVPLTPLLRPDDSPGPPDLEIALGIPLARGDADAEFGFPGQLRVLAHGGTRAYVEPAEGIGTGLLAEFIAGPVLAVLMEQRGAFVLHASAVQIGGRTVAFTGASGAGKSTTAAFFASRGFAVVSDDLLPLWVRGSQVVCNPGPEALKLTAETGEALPELVPTSRLTDKILRAPVRLTDSTDDKRLSAVYVLEDGPEISVRPLRGQDAMVALLRGAFCLAVVGPGRRAAQLARCAEVASRVQIRTLIRPRDLGRAGTLVELVVAEVESMAGDVGAGRDRAT